MIRRRSMQIGAREDERLVCTCRLELLIRVIDSLAFF